jgi:hypothetical protein
MGKKHGLKRQREEDDESALGVDPELEAELMAVRSIQAEQAAGGKPKLSAAELQANNEALSKLVESFRTKELGFVESMQIGDFSVHIEDENDDLAREVICFCCVAPDAAFKALF